MINTNISVNTAPANEARLRELIIEKDPDMPAEKKEKLNEMTLNSLVKIFVQLCNYMNETEVDPKDTHICLLFRKGEPAWFLIYGDSMDDQEAKSASETMGILKKSDPSLPEEFERILRRMAFSINLNLALSD